ncbi:hypothetical protein CTAYLR_005683 [Chrysophaeum taylorii]|uniref:RGS domain-containing protein n=1 Tax=Chrysophaeum taylorii TaxID=2483200 RepID=A0AAD7ULE3_9STRA|nr:hypothetical protein CTAYLR_005683 [Chrysophaeum taylorii]
MTTEDRRLTKFFKDGIPPRKNLRAAREFLGESTPSEAEGFLREHAGRVVEVALKTVAHYEKAKEDSSRVKRMILGEKKAVEVDEWREVFEVLERVAEYVAESEVVVELCRKLVNPRAAKTARLAGLKVLLRLGCEEELVGAAVSELSHSWEPVEAAYEASAWGSEEEKLDEVEAVDLVLGFSRSSDSRFAKWKPLISRLCREVWIPNAKKTFGPAAAALEWSLDPRLDDDDDLSPRDALLASPFEALAAEKASFLVSAQERACRVAAASKALDAMSPTERWLRATSRLFRVGKDDLVDADDRRALLRKVVRLARECEDEAVIEVIGAVLEARCARRTAKDDLSDAPIKWAEAEVARTYCEAAARHRIENVPWLATEPRLAEQWARLAAEAVPRRKDASPGAFFRRVFAAGSTIGSLDSSSSSDDDDDDDERVHEIEAVLGLVPVAAAIPTAAAIFATAASEMFVALGGTYKALKILAPWIFRFAGDERDSHVASRRIALATICDAIATPSIRRRRRDNVTEECARLATRALEENGKAGDVVVARATAIAGDPALVKALARRAPPEALAAIFPLLDPSDARFALEKVCSSLSEKKDPRCVALRSCACLVGDPEIAAALRSVEPTTTTSADDFFSFLANPELATPELATRLVHLLVREGTSLAGFETLGVWLASAPPQVFRGLGGKIVEALDHSLEPGEVGAAARRVFEIAKGRRTKDVGLLRSEDLGDAAGGPVRVDPGILFQRSSALGVEAWTVAPLEDTSCCSFPPPRKARFPPVVVRLVDSRRSAFEALAASEVEERERQAEKLALAAARRVAAGESSSKSAPDFPFFVAPGDNVLDAVLKDAGCLAALDDFLAREFAAEGLRFLCAVRAGVPVETLCDAYVWPDAPSQLNLPQRVVADVKDRLHSGDPSVLERAITEVKNLVESDNLARFLKVDPYGELVEAARAASASAKARDRAERFKPRSSSTSSRRRRRSRDRPPNTLSRWLLCRDLGFLKPPSWRFSYASSVFVLVAGFERDDQARFEAFLDAMGGVKTTKKLVDWLEPPRLVHALDARVTVLGLLATDDDSLATRLALALATKEIPRPPDACVAWDATPPTPLPSIPLVRVVPCAPDMARLHVNEEALFFPFPDGQHVPDARAATLALDAALILAKKKKIPGTSMHQIQTSPPSNHHHILDLLLSTTTPDDNDAHLRDT